MDEKDKANSEHDYISFSVWDASGSKPVDLLEEFEENDLIDLIQGALFPKVAALSTVCISFLLLRKIHGVIKVCVCHMLRSDVSV